MVFAINLFVNRDQIRLLNGKSTDLEWYYFRYNQKLKSLGLLLAIHALCGKKTC